MGISLQLESFDDMFFNKATRIPVVINDLSETTEGDKEAFNKMIYTKYASDLLSNLPTCECGEITGEAYKSKDSDVKRIICKNCNTPVIDVLEQNLEPLVWMRAPNGVRALINPIVWTMLSTKFTTSGFNVIWWLTDTTYKPTVKIPNMMDSVYALKITRGYNNFFDNFDTIMDKLFALKAFKPKKGKPESLQTLLKTQRNCIFSKYLPLPNRALIVIEETNVGTYSNPIDIGAVDAIRTMANIDSELSTHSVRTKENRTVKTIAQLATFYDDLYRTTLARKEGIFRKHVFGTRSHFSFRAVISSMTDNHAYDELHIPWGIGIAVFRIHLMNKLMRLGYTPNAGIALLNEHSGKYHPLLDQLFNQLIDESPGRAISGTLQRNPSLERGSAKVMRITKIKTNPSIPTISLSILSVVSYNADQIFN